MLKIIEYIRICYLQFFSVKIMEPYLKSFLGYCGNNVKLRCRLTNNKQLLSRIYMYDNTNIYENFNFVSTEGRLILKKNSGIASGATIITGNHQRKVGIPFKYIMGTETDIEKDVVIEEDVWIGCNTTIMCGVTIGRGATVGAGAVCIKNIPPYAVVLGNPAKVVGFNYTPAEIIEHEKKIYAEEERLPLSLLEKNYNKYYLSHIKEIKEWTRL